MIIRYSPAFLLKAKKLDIRIRKSLKEKIILFLKNHLDSRLNNHELEREYKGYRSINVNADYRVIYKEKKEGSIKIAYFIDIGTHKELYEAKRQGS